MSRIFSDQEERLLLLAVATYSSQSTQDIAMATQQIRRFIMQNYPKSFAKLEQLIILKQIDINTRKSLISHIKTVSLQLKQQLHIQSQHDPDILTNNKKLLHDIEHILANNQLEGTLKQPIAEAYVSLFVLFTPETYDKLLSKARYYLNTKQDLVALHILESYHHSVAPFKYKSEYYAKVFPLLAEHIAQKMMALLNDTAVDKNKQIVYLNAHLNLLAQIWTSMNFEKYESIFCNMLSSQKLYSIFQMFLVDNASQQLLAYLYSIATHAIAGLRRTGLFRKYSKFCRVVKDHSMQVLKKLMKKQFLLNDITEDYQVRSICANLRFLISGVDVYNEGLHLVGYQFSMYDIFTKLVYPNFKNIQKYLYNNSNNPQEMFSFLADLSFQMKSQCPEVLIHQFICSLTKHSQTVLAYIRTLIQSFLFFYLPKNSKGKVQFFKGSSFRSHLPFWCKISNFIPLKQLLLSILSCTALAATCFLKDINFLNGLNDYMGQNAQFFLTGDSQVQLFTLLVYRNYRADVFSNNRASSFTGLIVSKALQKGKQSINRKFILTILQEQFQEAPTLDDLAFSVMMIVEQMASNFDQELVYILFLILRNYKKDLMIKIGSIKQITAHIVNILEQWVETGNQLKGIQYYFAMICFLISSYSLQYSTQLFNKTLSIVQKSKNKADIKGQLILDILVQMLKTVESLPQNVEVILISLKWQFQSIEVLNSLTQLIKYSKNPIFLNWLVHKATNQEFTIHSALILQTVTYHKSLFLTYETIQLLLLKIYSYHILQCKEYNYISGKLNIVCLLLLRQQKKMVQDILLHPKWQDMQVQLKNEAKFNHLFTNQHYNSTIQLSALDEFYIMLYYNQNIYRWRYDIEVFLITQLKFFQTDLKDEVHLAYANVAMVACITNSIRALSYFQIQNKEFKGDTDLEQVNCRVDLQYEKHLSMMEKFNRPQEFNQDYFLLLRNWVNKLRKRHESNKWLQTILKQVFSQQNREIFESILHMQRCEGHKVRNVVKVQRIKGQDYQ